MFARVKCAGCGVVFTLTVAFQESDVVELVGSISLDKLLV